MSRILLLLGGFLVICVSSAAARAYPQQMSVDPSQTTSSFNWWPYPAWGASSPSAPILMTATLANTYSTVTSVSTDSVISPSSSTGTASTAESVVITTEPTTGTSGTVGTIVQATATLPIASTSSQEASTISPRPTTFKPIYLLPATIIGGAILGACVTAFIYSRWYSVREPLLRDDSISAGFPANREYHGMEEWEDEEDKRDEEEKRFIARPDDSGDDCRVGGRSSNGGPRRCQSSIPMPVPTTGRNSIPSSTQWPESDITKAKSGFSRARTTQTRRTEYDDVDSWYACEHRIEDDSNVGLSDEEPPSPYARLSDFRIPRATTSRCSGQELPDYDQDDPAQSLLPASVDRPGVFRRRVTPIHMRGHGRTNSNTVIPDVLRVPDRPLAGTLLPPSPASVYPEDKEEDPSLQKESPSLPRSSNNLPPWSLGYQYHKNHHALALSPPPSQLVLSDLSFSNPPHFSTVGSSDSLDLDLILENEHRPRVLPKRSGKVSKDFPASLSASSTFANPPSRFACKPELDSQQAFCKVDDIQRRSWDQRDVSDRPSSPTGFGAIIGDPSEVPKPLYEARQGRGSNGTGTNQVKFGVAREEDGSIEQRLAILRRKDNRFDRT